MLANLASQNQLAARFTDASDIVHVRARVELVKCSLLSLSFASGSVWNSVRFPPPFTTGSLRISVRFPLFLHRLVI
jgi:hypothetical protein